MSSLGAQLDGMIADDVSQVQFKHELAISGFTNALAARMSHQGISQADLARRLGVTRARVSQLLQHKSSPTLQTMVQVAHALGCEVRLALVPSGQTSGSATPQRSDSTRSANAAGERVRIPGS